MKVSKEFLDQQFNGVEQPEDLLSSKLGAVQQELYSPTIARLRHLSEKLRNGTGGYLYARSVGYTLIIQGVWGIMPVHFHILDYLSCREASFRATGFNCSP